MDAVAPIFEAMGKTIVHQGGPGAGQHTKMVNQILISSNMIALCEGLLYGYKAGLQLERMQAGYIPSLREYNRVFGVTRARLEKAPRDLLILHPGPMNRGVEIDSDVADGPHSVILQQVTNGVAVRMAVLYLLAGGRPELAEAAKGQSER